MAKTINSIFVKSLMLYFLVMIKLQIGDEAAPPPEPPKLENESSYVSLNSLTKFISNEGSDHGLEIEMNELAETAVWSCFCAQRMIKWSGLKHLDKNKYCAEASKSDSDIEAGNYVVMKDIIHLHSNGDPISADVLECKQMMGSGEESIVVDMFYLTRSKDPDCTLVFKYGEIEAMKDTGIEICYLSMKVCGLPIDAEDQSLPVSQPQGQENVT